MFQQQLGSLVQPVGAEHAGQREDGQFLIAKRQRIALQPGI